ncbi:MAG: lysozyme [Gemmataceae bacterium]|nr:lysozyme [Gemmataceae bacterium]
MTRQPSTTEAGLQLIRDFEGLRLEAYLCPAGLWTVGFGHAQGVKRGDRITEETAERLLLQDVAAAERAVRRQVTKVLNDNQFSALVSFCFNLGETKLRVSTLKDLVNQGRYAEAADEFPRWVFATVNGQKRKLPGLVKRRTAERELFLTPA